jgi:hypothetical protein
LGENQRFEIPNVSVSRCELGKWYLDENDVIIDRKHADDEYQFVTIHAALWLCITAPGLANHLASGIWKPFYCSVFHLEFPFIAAGNPGAALRRKGTHGVNCSEDTDSAVAKT